MKAEPIEFTVDGLRLKGKLFRPTGKTKNIAILFIHGWTGLPNEPAAAYLAGNGYCAMTFSLSGHNDSDGALQDQTRQKSLKETLAAYDFFRSKLPESVEIIAAGNSYGGYLAALLSAERPLAGVQMRVPANYQDEGFEKIQLGQGGENPSVMSWRHRPLDTTATKALRALNEFKGPVQIIEAELDEHVPHQTVQNYVGAVSGKSNLDYHFMQGWPHSLGLDKGRNSAYQHMLLDWLDNQL